MHTGNWLNKHQPFWLKLLKKFCKLRWCIVVLKIWNERLIKRCSGYYYFYWRTSKLVQMWEKVTTRDKKSSHRDHKKMFNISLSTSISLVITRSYLSYPRQGVSSLCKGFQITALLKPHWQPLILSLKRLSAKMLQ